MSKRKSAHSPSVKASHADRIRAASEDDIARHELDDAAASDAPHRASDYDVGYGKPPKATRFKKGQSGNPKGRPKGSKNLKTMFDEALKETVVVNIGGKKVRKSKMEVGITQQLNKAAAGDLKAFSVMARLQSQVEQEALQAASDRAATRGATAKDLAQRKARDPETMKALLRRMKGEEE